MQDTHLCNTYLYAFFGWLIFFFVGVKDEIEKYVFLDDMNITFDAKYLIEIFVLFLAK